MAAGQGTGNSILVANRTTSRVHEPGTLLEVLQEIVVDETLGAFVEWAVDSHDITLVLTLNVSVASRTVRLLERPCPKIFRVRYAKFSNQKRGYKPSSPLRGQH